MRHAEVRLATRHGATLRASLGPEADRTVPGTRVALDADDATFLLSVEAEDTGTLRAALNSYLRWAAGALRMVEEAGR